MGGVSASITRAWLVIKRKRSSSRSAEKLCGLLRQGA